MKKVIDPFGRLSKGSYFDLRVIKGVVYYAIPRCVRSARFSNIAESALHSSVGYRICLAKK